MDELVYRGVIIRQANYGDAHRMLWIYTETDGIIKAVRYGVRGKKTSNAAAFQMFCYADFKLRPSRGEIMTAVSADVLEGFYPMSENIRKLALASYFSDITYGILGEANPDKRILSLLLNALYAMSYRDEELIKVKTVYELKLMCAGGYMPQIPRCGVCGAEGEYFSFEKGAAVCREHHNAQDMKISAGVFAVMKYIISCEDKKMLSFAVNDRNILDELNALTEKYIQVQCDLNCKSLNYFYSICNA